MNTESYLKRILESERVPEGGQEMADMDKHRDAVAALLAKAFSKSTPAIRFGGSRAKDTMNISSYDADISVRFARDDSGPGTTLKEIFDNVSEVLSQEYTVEKKRSALRLKSKQEKHLDIHIDVVPGRFTDEDRDDVYIHQSSGDKDWLKTNLEKHISHIRNSGLTETIRLAKYWNFCEGLQIKTFVLELLVIKALDGVVDASGLASNMEAFWSYLVDHRNSLCVEDPANTNNDLSDHIDDIRDSLCDAAEGALQDVADDSWGSIFGTPRNPAVPEEKDMRIQVITQAVATQVKPVKPWANPGL